MEVHLSLIELFAWLEMDPQKLSMVAVRKTGAAAKKLLILGSYLDIHPGWNRCIEKRESRTVENINALKKTKENGAQRSVETWALYDKLVLPDKSKRETNSEGAGIATDGTQDGMSSDDSDTCSLWSISSLETSEAQSNNDKSGTWKDDLSDTSSLWSISSLETSDAQSNNNKSGAGKDDHSDTSSLWSISSQETSDAQSNNDKSGAGKDDHSDTSSLWSVSSLETSEAQSNTDKSGAGKDDDSDTSSLWSISSLETSEAQSNKDKSDAGKDDHSDTSSLWSISSLETSADSSSFYLFEAEEERAKMQGREITTGRSAPCAAPGRNGPSRAPARQRRTDRNLRVGMDKHLNATSRQGGLMDPHKAGSRASTRRSPAREAVAEDEIWPRVGVNRNHNAPAQSRGRLRRGWTRFSVATRRIFRRCLPRCCVSNGAD